MHSPIPNRCGDASTTKSPRGILLQIANSEHHAKADGCMFGTTNLDSQQLVVWDLGAIAAGTDRNRLSLFRDLLLASCSVPGLLPPVPINIDIDGKHFTELHADGGVSASLFLLPQTLGIDTSDLTQRVAGIASVHVVVAGKLIPDRMPVDGGILRISDASLHGLMRAQMESDLKRVYLLTRKARAEFRLAAIPQDASVNAESIVGSPQGMHDLFEVGRAIGRTGGPWRDTPLGVAPNEWPIPRAGVHFSKVENAASVNQERPDKVPEEHDLPGRRCGCRNEVLNHGSRGNSGNIRVPGTSESKMPIQGMSRCMSSKTTELKQN